MLTALSAFTALFKKNVHDMFFNDINYIIIDVVETTVPLNRWVRNRRNEDFTNCLYDVLDIAQLVVRSWNKLHDFLYNSDGSTYLQQREGKVGMGTWAARRKESMDTVERLLRFLGDPQMESSARGIMELQDGLRRQWRNDGEVERQEAERMGWVRGLRN